MNIALFDYDAIKNSQRFRLNLEIMKLSSYYKGKNQVVRNLLNATLYQQFSKIIIRKDKINDDFPDALLQLDTVEFGGLGFTDGIYVPMELDIEQCLPDRGIYNEYIAKNVTVQSILTRTKTDLNSSLIRLSLDGKTYMPGFEKFLENGRPRIKIYDQDFLNLPDVFDLLKDWKNSGRRMTTHMPIQVYSRAQLDKVISCGVFNKSTPINFCAKLDTKEFKDIVSSYDNYRVNFIFGLRELRTEREIVYELEEVLRRLIYLKLNRRENEFYHKPGSLSRSPYIRAIRLVEHWSSVINERQSILDYAKKKQATSGANILIELSAKYPELYRLCYTNITTFENKRGIWVL